MHRALALTGLLLAACTAEPTEPPPGLSQLELALPRAEVMRIDMPSGPFQVAQQATFYSFTWGTTTTINGFVRTITSVIEDVVERPPSQTDHDTFAVWGPWTEPLSPATWQVRVDRVAPGRFEYVLQGWPRNAGPEQAVTVLDGEHVVDGDTRRGRWHYDLSAARGLDPIVHAALGAVDVTFSLDEARALEVQFTDVQGRHDPQTTSTLYRYTEAADRSGTFDYISNLDIHDDEPHLDRRELLRVRARWTPEGPGRADVLATHGDLPAGVEADLVECWDAAFLASFVDLRWGPHQHGSGDASTCVFADRQLPQFDAFDPATFADEALFEALPQPDEFEVEPAPIADPVETPAVYYQIAKGAIEHLRSHTGWALQTVRNVTRHPASRCTEAACQWGPWTDWDARLSYTLHAARGPEQIGYRLSMRPFGTEPWTPVLEGGFVPEIDDRGQGWFTVNYDAIAEFEPGEALRGGFRAEYARMGEQRALAARFDEIQWAGEPAFDARYFLLSGPEGGVLDAAFPADVDDDPARPAREEIEARVRWIANGAGVGNVIVRGGDIQPTLEGLGVECWDDRAASVYADNIARAVGTDRLPDTDGPGCVITDWQDPELPPMGDEPGAD